MHYNNKAPDNSWFATISSQGKSKSTISTLSINKGNGSKIKYNKLVLTYLCSLSLPTCMPLGQIQAHQNTQINAIMSYALSC